jgi:hypothetical protein
LGGYVAKTVVVGGMFNVTFDVVDQRGKSVPSIDATTAQAYNIVTIKNFGPVPKAVEVEVSLPGGVRPLEFLVAGNGTSTWTDITPLIASNGRASLDCRLRRGSGPNRRNEPIQFHRLAQRPAVNLSFSRVSDPNVPFQITVDAG